VEVDKLVRELARLRSDNRALIDENERLRRERGRAIMPASESLYRSVVAAMHEGVVVQDVAAPSWRATTRPSTSSGSPPIR